MSHSLDVGDVTPNKELGLLRLVPPRLGEDAPEGEAAQPSPARPHLLASVVNHYRGLSASVRVITMTSSGTVL